MSWAQAEFHDLELGDARQTHRLIKLVDDLSAQPTGSIPLACGGWPETKAAYRLLDNPAVEWREILDVHTQRTVERMAGQPVVLCIQDTTELDFTTQPGIAGLGRLSYEAQHGLYMHPTLAVTPAGVALGVLTPGCGHANPKTSPTSRKAPAGSGVRDRRRSGRDRARDPAGVRGGSGRRSAGVDRRRRPARHASGLADPSSVTARPPPVRSCGSGWPRATRWGRSNSPCRPHRIARPGWCGRRCIAPW